MKNKKVKKIILISLAVILIIAGGVFSYGYYQLNRIQKVEIDKSNDAVGINPDYEQKLEEKLNIKLPNVTNILFLGVDKEENASDSIIVLSINEDTKKVKMSSIMRDSYIDFEGQPVKKINYAYHYGGVQLAVKTVNENYDLNIRDYVKIDFEGLTKIIDLMGGVQINIKSYEVSTLSKYGITKTGTYNLSGTQALAYSRIRKVGQADYERTQRQRLVLTTLFNKVKAKGVGAYAAVLPKILSNVETSMSNTDIMALGNKMLAMDVNKIEELRLPLDGYKQEKIINDIWYLLWDKQPNVDALHKFIYEDSK